MFEATKIRTRVLGGLARERAAAPPLAVSNERVLLVARVPLALGGLLAEYLDPTQPQVGELAYAFLGAYAFYSLALFVGTYNNPVTRYGALASHALELALVSLIIVNTEGPTSPFFLYFTFLLLVAALRWEWRGTLITGALLAVILIGTTASQFIVAFDKLDVDRLIVRNVYLLVATGLFAFFGSQLGRSNREAERLATAEELHDGILQSLTAVQMKVGSLSRHTTGDTRDRLLEVSELLCDEHRRVRKLVEEARESVASTPANLEQIKISQLRAEASHLQQLWGCNIRFGIQGRDTHVSPQLARTIKLMVGEAIANSVLHGRADYVCVEVATSQNGIDLRIQDNGLGLGDIAGAYEHAQLAAHGLGPRSIRRRVERLGGSIRLESTEHGVLLEIGLPLGHNSKSMLS
jgi:signal transduction histidine kinase